MTATFWIFSEYHLSFSFINLDIGDHERQIHEDRGFADEVLRVREALWRSHRAVCSQPGCANLWFSLLGGNWNIMKYLSGRPFDLHHQWSSSGHRFRGTDRSSSSICAEFLALPSSCELCRLERLHKHQSEAGERHLRPIRKWRTLDDLHANFTW